jgi:hypothetical protein
MTFGESTVNWLDPLAFAPGRILEAKELPAASGTIDTLGELQFQQRYQWNMNTSRGSLTIKLDYQSNTAGGNQALKELKVGARYEDRTMPHSSLQRLRQNRQGEDETFKSPVKLTDALKKNLNQWHDAGALGAPREKLVVGKTWKANSHSVTLDYLFGYDADQQLNLSCEYLGAYVDGSKTIGVVRMQGEISEQGQKPHSKCSGLALIDGETRQLIDFMLRADGRKRTSGPVSIDSSASIEGVMQLRLQRKS